ncbi:MAG TPA: S8 family serine peptidase, partial [Candidatus Paceibacterota bacterium]|nr:S8 family serine peptidase [Candidatus Paceibacterota bacterium]
MLTVSFSTFITVSGSSSVTQLNEPEPDNSEPLWEKSTSWKTKKWDWQALADADGFVRVIVSVQDDNADTKSSEARMGGLSSVLGEKAGYLKTIDSYSAELTLDSLSSLLSDPEIIVYPDLIVEASLAESVGQVGADELWAMRDPSNVLVTGTGIVVAIIDTGVDYTHPDLGGGFGTGYKVIGGYDFVNDDSDPIDDNGHGTHCAGIVAASGGITGVAPGASILAYKALDAGGQGYMSDVILAIDRAMDPNDDGDTGDHADVISMSLGGAGEVDDPVCIAVRNAVEAGVTVVVAAGNEGPSMGTVASPGLAAEAITVGAIDKSDNLATFSSRGTIPDLAIKPEISAPGVSITSTVPFSGTRLSSPTGYYSASGTSMAT